MIFSNTLNKKTIFSFLFFLIPFSYIGGNLAVNLNFLVITLCGIVMYKKEFTLFKEKKILILFLAFFLLIIFSTIINYFKIFELSHVIKSFVYIRYFFLIQVVYFAVKNNDVELKYFFQASLTCTLFLSIDIIYQSVVGQDFFGFKRIETHNSGYFNTELIAGGYMLKFFLPASFFLIPAVIKKFNFWFTFSFLIIFAAIMLSGNRMPFFSTYLFLFLSIIFLKELRINLFIILFITPLIYLFIYNNNEGIKISHQSFWGAVPSMHNAIFSEIKRDYPELKNEKGTLFASEQKKKLKKNLKVKDYDVYAVSSGHVPLFVAGIDTWLDNPLMGSGLRSFRVSCKTKLHLPNRMCDTHPHNYYIEILNTVGLLGLLIFVFLIFLIIRNKLKGNLNTLHPVTNLKINFLILAILVDLFPIKSSGSFFSSLNSSYLFFLISIIIAIKIDNKIRAKVSY